MLERRIDRRLILRVAGLGTALVVAGPPLLHINNTIRLFGAAFGQEIDCATDKEAESKSYPFDAIVVPGGGTVLTPQGTRIPSDYQQLRLEGAAVAYSKNLAPRIILLDGIKGPFDGGLTSKTYLQESFQKLTGGNAFLPDEAIIIEHRSINTATNMSELRRIVVARNIKKVLIVTNEYHETRATLFACEYGVPASSTSAEDLIIEVDPERKGEIHRLYHTPQVGTIETKETLEVIWSLWDPKGRVPTLLRKLTK